MDPVHRSVADYGWPPSAQEEEPRALEERSDEVVSTEVARLQRQIEQLQSLVREQQREIRRLRGV